MRETVAYFSNESLKLERVPFHPVRRPMQHKLLNIVVTTFHVATAEDCYLVYFSPSTLPPLVALMKVTKQYRRHFSKDHRKLKPEERKHLDTKLF